MHENHTVALKLVDQKETAAGMTFPMVHPIPFQGMVEPFRA